MKFLRDWLKMLHSDMDGDCKLPPAPSSVSEFYRNRDHENLWQGDIFNHLSFPADSTLPTDQIEYWMLMNRTCQMYANGAGRAGKLTHLNYMGVLPLSNYLSFGKKEKSLKNQIKWLINGDTNVIFLPESPAFGVNQPLIGIFNLIATVSSEKSPRPSQKTLQLSSPFSEHVFQKLSRFFYTVGFDDEELKNDDYYNRLAEDMAEFQRKKN